MVSENDVSVKLLDNEEVIEKRHPSWTEWSLLIGFAALVLLFGLGSGDAGGVLGGLVVGGGILGYVYYARNSSEYVVTNQRVVKRVGVLRKSTGEARIEDIRSLETDASLLQRLIGKGTVQIDSAGAGGLLGIAGVENYEELANTIRQQQQQVSN